eukprot:1054022-Prymnesium_polylepis.1
MHSKAVGWAAAHHIRVLFETETRLPAPVLPSSAVPNCVMSGSMYFWAWSAMKVGDGSEESLNEGLLDT